MAKSDPAYPGGTVKRVKDAEGRWMPTVLGDEASGLTKLEWFAGMAPKPSDSQMNTIAEGERMANPHGDSYKPRRRSWLEIECALRFDWAEAMLAESEKRNATK